MDNANRKRDLPELYFSDGNCCIKSQASKGVYMSKKIPPRVREQAAIYCSAMASWWMSHWSTPTPDSTPEIHGLASNARRFVWMSGYRDMPGDRFYELNAKPWAEAEALLRTGWKP